MKRDEKTGEREEEAGETGKNIEELNEERRNGEMKRGGKETRTEGKKKR